VPRAKGDKRGPNDIPESERYYFLEERYPSFGNLVPRDVASRNAKQVCDEGLGVGATGLAVYLDFRDAIKRDSEAKIRERYGNLFDMYEKISGENPYKVPMKIYPAVHYTMGGLWVDYNLMSTVPGLFVLGEANFSDHGANRLGASALMQGLADGYFVIPYTLGDYLVNQAPKTVDTSHEAFQAAEHDAVSRIHKLFSVKGNKTVLDYHRALGKIVWDEVGMSRNRAGLERAIRDIRAMKADFWENVFVPGEPSTYNKYLEYALRVADFMELGELMAIDALDREESCGGHFREEYQTPEGEAERNDDAYAYVAAWEFRGEHAEPKLHTEALTFDNVALTQRSYK
jgi:succinate dehydrogenase / fumarate reductase flavoprotein subunit